MKTPRPNHAEFRHFWRAVADRIEDFTGISEEEVFAMIDLVAEEWEERGLATKQELLTFTRKAKEEWAELAEKRPEEIEELPEVEVEEAETPGDVEGYSREELAEDEEVTAWRGDVRARQAAQTEATDNEELGNERWGEVER